MNFKKVLLGLAAVLFLGLAFTPPSELANATVVDQCNQEFVYTKSSDFSDSRVNINFENSDEQIDVAGVGTYQVIKVELDVEDDGHAGYFTYATGPVNNFNPNPGDEIDSAKVTVKKVCPTATPTVTPTTTPTVTPTSTPTVTPTATPTVTPTVTPGPTVNPCDGQCPTVSPTPDVTPEVTPTASPTPPPTGGPGGDGGGQGVFVCTLGTPGDTSLLSVVVNGPDSLKLTWTAAEGATDYTIQYGLAPDTYTFGVPSTGNVTSYVVGALDLSKNYYFRVIALNGCRQGDPSSEAWAAIGGPAVKGLSNTSGSPLAAAYPLVGFLSVFGGLALLYTNASKKS